MRDESRKRGPWLMETMHGIGTERERIARYAAARAGAKARPRARLAIWIAVTAVLGLVVGALGTWLLLRR